MWFLSMGLRQRSGLCSSSSRKYPGSEGTYQNRHSNHHRWHATDSLGRNWLSCWCCRITYRAPVRYVTKTCSVVLLNKKYIYCYIKCIVYDKSLKPCQSFWITLNLWLIGIDKSVPNFRITKNGKWYQVLYLPQLMHKNYFNC